MPGPVTAATTRLLAAVPNPGAGTEPPGGEKLITVLQWAAWLSFGVCVLGAIVAGAMMALSASGRHDGGARHASSLGWVFAGCVVIGSASGLVGALV